MLWDNGADFTSKDAQKNTVVHYAAANNKVEILNFILEKGIDYKQKNNNGKTPLDEARSGNAEACINVLEKLPHNPGFGCRI